MKLLRELYDYRTMMASLVRRDLRGRYKGSVLGFLWTFVNPLLQFFVYTVVFSVILKNDIPKYYLFLFVALIPFLFFSSCLTGGATAVLNQKDMVKKIYFPREVLPISFVTTCFVNMLFCFVIVFAVVFISGVRLDPVGLLFLPLVMLVEYLMALGIAFITSAVTVYFRDLEYILGILAMLWMYMTPVMYAPDIVPEQIRPVFNLNPMTYIINAYRDILYYGKRPDAMELLYGFLLGLALLAIGLVVFEKLKKHFVEEL